MFPEGFFDGITLKAILQFGFAGVTLFMLYSLNVGWQKVVLKLGEKFNESLNGLGLRFQRAIDELKDVLINPEKHRGR
jgi:hypothetical protein